MGFQVLFFPNDAGTVFSFADTRLTPLDVDYQVKQMTWSDKGTYGDARVTASGAFSQLASLARKIGYYAEIRDDRGDCIWHGKFHRLMLRSGDIEHIVTMEPVANIVSLVYYKVTYESEGLGPRTQTDWKEQPGMKARYGRHEKVVSRAKLTQAAAEAELDRLLAMYSQPEYTVRTATGPATCELDLKGLWYYMQRQYYRNVDATSKYIASPDKGGYVQNFGEGSGIDAVCFPFWTEKRTFSMIHWTVYTSDTFDATAVTVKLNKVVDGFGANAQPTDSVVCEICEDATYGVYIAQLNNDGDSTDNIIAVGPKLRTGGANPDGNWNGLWPNLTVRAMKGTPDYGQSPAPAAPTNPGDGLYPPDGFKLRFKIVNWAGGFGRQSVEMIQNGVGENQVPENWDDYVNDTAGYVAGPGAVIATSEPVPAAQIPTAAGEVTFRFTTPFTVGGQSWNDAEQFLEPQRRLWMRFRRTEPYTDETNKRWLGKGYYQLQGFTPQSAMGDVETGFPYGRPNDAYILTHHQTKAITEWRSPIPGVFRPEVQGTKMQLGAALWFRVGGVMQTDAQLWYMAVSSEMFSQVVIESPNPGVAWGSGIYTLPYRDGSKTTQEEISKLVDRGTSSGRGLIFEITPDRTAVIKYEPLPDAAVTQLQDGTFVTATGAPMRTFPPPVGQYVQMQSTLYLLDADRLGTFYCKEASWDDETGMQLVPRTSPPLGQLPSIAE